MKTRILLFVLISSLLFSCRNEYFDIGCIFGNEKIESETRELNYFEGISMSGSFEVYLTQEDKSEILIETDENLFEHIKTRITGDILYVETKNSRCIRPSETIKVFISTPDIREINLSGSGIIVCDTLSSDKLYVRISGSGDVELNMDVEEFEANISGSGEMDLTGIASETDIRISGSGEINAKNLFQQACFIHISGSGDARVRVEEYLDVNISGSGSVYYYGSPEVNVSISGSGKMIKM